MDDREPRDANKKQVLEKLLPVVVKELQIYGLIVDLVAVRHEMNQGTLSLDVIVNELLNLRKADIDELKKGGMVGLTAVLEGLVKKVDGVCGVDGENCGHLDTIRKGIDDIDSVDVKALGNSKEVVKGGTPLDAMIAVKNSYPDGVQDKVAALKALFSNPPGDNISDGERLDAVFIMRGAQVVAKSFKTFKTPFNTPQIDNLKKDKLMAAIAEVTKVDPRGGNFDFDQVEKDLITLEKSVDEVKDYISDDLLKSLNEKFAIFKKVAGRQKLSFDEKKATHGFHDGPETLKTASGSLTSPSIDREVSSEEGKELIKNLQTFSSDLLKLMEPYLVEAMPIDTPFSSQAADDFLNNLESAKKQATEGFSAIRPVRECIGKFNKFKNSMKAVDWSTESNHIKNVGDDLQNYAKAYNAIVTSQPKTPLLSKFVSDIKDKGEAEIFAAFKLVNKQEMEKELTAWETALKTLETDSVAKWVDKTEIHVLLPQTIEWLKNNDADAVVTCLSNKKMVTDFKDVIGSNSANLFASEFSSKNKNMVALVGHSKDTENIGNVLISNSKTPQKISNSGAVAKWTDPRQVSIALNLANEYLDQLDLVVQEKIVLERFVAAEPTYRALIEANGGTETTKMLAILDEYVAMAKKIVGDAKTIEMIEPSDLESLAQFYKNDFGIDEKKNWDFGELVDVLKKCKATFTTPSDEETLRHFKLDFANGNKILAAGSAALLLTVPFFTQLQKSPQISDPDDDASEDVSSTPAAEEENIAWLIWKTGRWFLLGIGCFGAVAALIAWRRTCNQKKQEEGTKNEQKPLISEKLPGPDEIEKKKQKHVKYDSWMQDINNAKFTVCRDKNGNPVAKRDMNMETASERTQLGGDDDVEEVKPDLKEIKTDQNAEKISELTDEEAKHMHEITKTVTKSLQKDQEEFDRIRRDPSTQPYTHPYITETLLREAAKIPAQDLTLDDIAQFKDNEPVVLTPVNVLIGDKYEIFEEEKDAKDLDFYRNQSKSLLTAIPGSEVDKTQEDPLEQSNKIMKPKLQNGFGVENRKKAGVDYKAFGYFLWLVSDDDNNDNAYQESEASESDSSESQLPESQNEAPESHSAAGRDEDEADENTNLIPSNLDDRDVEANMPEPEQNQTSWIIQKLKQLFSSRTHGGKDDHKQHGKQPRKPPTAQQQIDEYNIENEQVLKRLGEFDNKKGHYHLAYNDPEDMNKIEKERFDKPIRDENGNIVYFKLLTQMMNKTFIKYVPPSRKRRNVSKEPRPNYQYHFSKETMEKICNEAKALFEKDAASLVLNRKQICQITDIHGQYRDMVIMIVHALLDCETTIVFSGDICDRGPRSMDCLFFLFLLKILFPNRIYLSRGNHETNAVNAIYGLLNECRQDLGFDLGTKMWMMFNNVFREVPVLSILQNQIFCCHGGFSDVMLEMKNLAELIDTVVKQPTTLRQVKINKCCEWADAVLLYMWAARKDQINFTTDEVRGGMSVVNFTEYGAWAVLEIFGLKMIIRGHQIQLLGWLNLAAGKILTIYSSPKNKKNNFGVQAFITPDMTIRLRRLVNLDGLEDEEFMTEKQKADKAAKEKKERKKTAKNVAKGVLKAERKAEKEKMQEVSAVEK